jgi:hypothetical protein
VCSDGLSETVVIVRLPVSGVSKPAGGILVAASTVTREQFDCM